LTPPHPDDDDDDFRSPNGTLVMPGQFKVTLSQRVAGAWTDLAQPQSFNVIAEGTQQMPPADRASLVAFQRKVARLQGAVIGAVETSNSVKERIVQIDRALQATPAADRKLLDDAQAIRQRLDVLQKDLSGDRVLRSYQENTPPSISDRVSGIVSAQRLSTSHPTQTQMDAYAIAAKEFVPVLTQLHQLFEVDLANLEKSMDLAGAPHTPGRLPNWKPE
jgi:hypothetical protein